MRSVAANAAAISEAKSELVKKKKGRPRKVPNAVVQEKNDKIAKSITGLDFLHDTTMRCIEGTIMIIRLSFRRDALTTNDFTLFFRIQCRRDGSHWLCE